jgi:hypothetical protein
MYIWSETKVYIIISVVIIFKRTNPTKFLSSLQRQYGFVGSMIYLIVLRYNLCRAHCDHVIIIDFSLRKKIAMLLSEITCIMVSEQVYMKLYMMILGTHFICENGRIGNNYSRIKGLLRIQNALVRRESCLNIQTNLVFTVLSFPLGNQE